MRFPLPEPGPEATGSRPTLVMPGCYDSFVEESYQSGARAAVGAGTGYGAGKGALIGTGVGAAAGAIYDITKK